MSFAFFLEWSFMLGRPCGHLRLGFTWLASTHGILSPPIPIPQTSLALLLQFLWGCAWLCPRTSGCQVSLIQEQVIQTCC